MSHAYHGDLIGTVLYDDCEECESRTGLPGMVHIDNTNLKTLATMAKLEASSEVAAQYSVADWVAIGNLRLMARIVFASGITEEVAR